MRLAWRISSGSSCQFFKVPLTRPETTMNNKTRMLIHVKTLFTIADSLTPKASRPGEDAERKKKMKTCCWRCKDRAEVKDRTGEAINLPVRVIMMTTANMSGYSANTPGAFMAMYALQKCSMRFPTNSSKVALHARATLEVPEVEKEQPS